MDILATSAPLTSKDSQTDLFEPSTKTGEDQCATNGLVPLFGRHHNVAYCDTGRGAVHSITLGHSGCSAPSIDAMKVAQYGHIVAASALMRTGIACRGRQTSVSWNSPGTFSPIDPTSLHSDGPTPRNAPEPNAIQSTVVGKLIAQESVVLCLLQVYEGAVSVWILACWQSSRGSDGAGGSGGRSPRAPSRQNPKK